MRDSRRRPRQFEEAFEMKPETILEIKKLISRHAHCSMVGDADAANAAYREYTFRIGLCLASDSQFAIAEQLLASSIPAHRYVGAYYLLPYQPRKAAYVLHRLFPVKENLLGVNAKTLYHEWKKGRLKFPILSADRRTIAYVDSKTYLDWVLKHE